MRKLVSLSVLFPAVVLLAGCPKKPGAGADAGEEAAAPAATAEVVDAAPAAPNAKNSAEVARFPAEKPLVDDDEKTVDAVAQVRSGPKSGANVAVLKAGTDPFKISEFQDCILVTFPDPRDASVTLMGWLPKAAFTVDAVPVDAGAKDAGKDAGPTDAGAAKADGGADAGQAHTDAGAKPTPLKCPPGQEAVIHVGTAGAACRKKCVADKDCKTPKAGACAPATTQAGKITKVCAAEVP